jgi:hypothetical protein
VAGPSPAGARAPAPGGSRGSPGQPGVIGIGLAAVLTFALAQGSWEWFSTYVGVTLLAVILSFSRPSTGAPGVRPGHLGGLAAYSLVVGLCTALALAPAMQRWSWLFPMPGSRAGCPELGSYEGIRTQAALGNLAGRDSAALAYAQVSQSHAAVADCLAATTTRWLPVYGAGAAVLVALAAWLVDRARARG